MTEPSRPTSPGRARYVTGRVIVPAILGITVTLSAVDAIVAKYFDEDPFDREPLTFRFGFAQFEVAETAPPLDFIILAFLAIVVIAIGSVILEALATWRTVFPPERRPSHLLPDTPSRLRVTALIPAHNEADNLPQTIPALRDQSRPPDRVVVVADNCEDATVDVARALGAEVFETQGNVDRKAGALNQALTALQETLTAEDVILVLDADTRLGAEFIEAGLAEFDANPELDAIGGLFYGEPGHGLIGQLQRNEYYRYQLQIRHRRGRVFVLTGTASIFRAEALAEVAASRGSLIPGQAGDVYDASAITEDNELTIALKSLGCQMTSPSRCVVETELMPTWRTLWVQRKRWQRGALDNLSEYGVTTATARYWGQQVGIAYGTVALIAAYVMLGIALLAMTQWVWFPFWIAVTLIFVVERTATVWHGGWKARLLAAPLLIEIGYSFFLQANFISSLVDLTLGRGTQWGHLPSTTTEPKAGDG